MNEFAIEQSGWFFSGSQTLDSRLKLFTLQHQVDSLELEKEDLEQELSAVKRQNNILSEKLNVTFSACKYINKVEEENNFLHQQIQLMTEEMNKMKRIMCKKDEWVIAKEAWITSLETGNERLEKEIEVLHCQIDKQNRFLALLTSDIEAIENEMMFERKEHDLQQTEAFSRIAELENEITEIRQLMSAERDDFRQKSQDYEDSLLTAYGRAHQLSAMLNKAERKIQEKKRLGIWCSFISCFSGVTSPVCDRLEFYQISRCLAEDIAEENVKSNKVRTDVKKAVKRVFRASSFTRRRSGHRLC